MSILYTTNPKHFERIEFLIKSLFRDTEFKGSYKFLSALKKACTTYPFMYDLLEMWYEENDMSKRQKIVKMMEDELYDIAITAMQNRIIGQGC